MSELAQARDLLVWHFGLRMPANLAHRREKGAATAAKTSPFLFCQTTKLNEYARKSSLREHGTTLARGLFDRGALKVDRLP
jgi:hypothetical protein